MTVTAIATPDPTPCERTAFTFAAARMRLAMLEGRRRVHKGAHGLVWCETHRRWHVNHPDIDQEAKQ